MGFASDSGYTPTTIEEIMAAVMEGVNDEFETSYTAETFIGTNFYKFFYALAQRLQESEIKTSEIFSYLQQYFDVTNERIQRPVGTPPGLIENFAAAGWTASVKPMIDADAGKIYVCVDVDSGGGSYATEKLEINTIIKDSVAAGIVSQGTETSAIVLSNGQSFDFKFNLPNRIQPLLRLTTVLSENNQLAISSPDTQKALLMANIAAKYSLGKNFEPQQYFSTVDAPWASSVLLEYKIGGGSWLTAVIDANYNDLYEIELANITLVET